MIRLFLGLLVPFKPLLKRMGVNTDQLWLLLRTKLTLDNRRSSPMQGNSKPTKNRLGLMGFLYIFLGLYIGLLISMMESLFTSMVIFHSFLMVMIAVSMISEFTTVLFDTRDNDILLPRPIDSRTLAVSRILHIGLYLLFIGFSLGLVGIITSFVKFGLAGGLSVLFSIALNILFTLFLTNLFYLGMMRLATGERLKDILVYFQIFMAILFFGGYQIMPELMEMDALETYALIPTGWTLLAPPAWLAGLNEVMGMGNTGGIYLALAALAILMPILGLWLVVRVFAPTFSHRLGQLAAAGGNDPQGKGNLKSDGSYPVGSWLGKVLMREQIERTSFNLTWRLSGRERLFKQSVFPAFGYMLVFIFMPFFSNWSELGEKLVAWQSGDYFLFPIYMGMMVGSSIAMSLGFGEKNEVDWWFRAMPIDRPGSVYFGALHAVMFRYMVPFQLLVSLGVGFFWGPQVIDDLIFGFLVQWMVMMLQFRQMATFPFSQARETQQGSKNFGRFALTMMGVGLMVGVHYLLLQVSWGVGAGLVILGILSFVTAGEMRKIAW
ncbi:MAG: hypothetical protein AAFR61_26145 [Bacteroidota bacterium]